MGFNLADETPTHELAALKHRFVGVIYKRLLQRYALSQSGRDGDILPLIASSSTLSTITTAPSPFTARRMSPARAFARRLVASAVPARRCRQRTGTSQLHLSAFHCGTGLPVVRHPRKNRKEWGSGSTQNDSDRDHGDEGSYSSDKAQHQ